MCFSLGVTKTSARYRAIVDAVLQLLSQAVKEFRNVDLDRRRENLTQQARQTCTMSLVEPASE
jgi:hypothetical protein